MSDLVQNPALVSISTGVFPITLRGIAGEALIAGMPAYQNVSDLKWYKGRGAGSAAQAGQYGAGIVMDSSPGAGQYCTILQSGRFNPGCAVTPGVVYCMSANAGAICPYTDLVSGNYITIIGCGIDTATIETPRSGPYPSNTQHP